ncbi:DUF418 domain-containing protein [Streptomyces griseocarneus]|uniref:DUF418 domain-containing protein n=1 Tax=Streptomyces griseocarneus TaxID=51201 RepID=UPI00167D4B0F|nr:DUF418 domain-containing protein [Streptomyces griseocarneus]MBZ6474293.1 DUF418 domain-containing protein [Streptomyces griseocarneus]GHG53134.1 hypothetical protein GCM10018779_14880 [Streptomyces griseocarneus]
MSDTVRPASGSPAETIAGPRPAAPAGRLPLLDVLRGAAILGTLMTNVWIFAAPGAEWGILEGGADGSSLRRLFSEPSLPLAAESVFRFLADGKFLAMLTMLFGVGLAIQFGSAARRGQPWPGRYPRRALFLFAEGTLHFVLVFAWDVLMGYAVTALLVAWLLTRTERFRRVVMWTAASLHLAFMSLVTLGAAASSGSGGGDGPDRSVVDLYADGGYPDQILFRLSNAGVLRMEPVLSFGLLVFLFLLGVRLFRAGAFGPDATGRRLRARLLGWGLGLGLPLNLAVSLAGPDFFLLSRYVAAPVLALGYLGLIGVLTDRLRGGGPLTTGLTSVGRTALSCYVTQNVLCALASYGIGLGLAARLDGSGPWWVMGMWAVTCLLLMAGSTLWLRRFSTGPLEAVQKWALRR